MAHELPEGFVPRRGVAQYPDPAAVGSGPVVGPGCVRRDAGRRCVECGGGVVVDIQRQAVRCPGLVPVVDHDDLVELVVGDPRGVNSELSVRVGVRAAVSGENHLVVARVVRDGGTIAVSATLEEYLLAYRTEARLEPHLEAGVGRGDRVKRRQSGRGVLPGRADGAEARYAIDQRAAVDGRVVGCPGSAHVGPYAEGDVCCRHVAGVQIDKGTARAERVLVVADELGGREGRCHEFRGGQRVIRCLVQTVDGHGNRGNIRRADDARHEDVEAVGQDFAGDVIGDPGDSDRAVGEIGELAVERDNPARWQRDWGPGPAYQVRVCVVDPPRTEDIALHVRAALINGLEVLVHLGGRERFAVNAAGRHRPVVVGVVDRPGGGVLEPAVGGTPEVPEPGPVTAIPVRDGVGGRADERPVHVERTEVFAQVHDHEHLEELGRGTTAQQALAVCHEVISYLRDLDGIGNPEYAVGVDHDSRAGPAPGFEEARVLREILGGRLDPQFDRRAAQVQAGPQDFRGTVPPARAQAGRCVRGSVPRIGRANAAARTRHGIERYPGSEDPVHRCTAGRTEVLPGAHPGAARRVVVEQQDVVRRSVGRAHDAVIEGEIRRDGRTRVLPDAVDGVVDIVVHCGEGVLDSRDIDRDGSRGHLADGIRDGVAERVAQRPATELLEGRRGVRIVAEGAVGIHEHRGAVGTDRVKRRYAQRVAGIVVQDGRYSSGQCRKERVLVRRSSVACENDGCRYLDGEERLRGIASAVRDGEGKAEAPSGGRATDEVDVTVIDVSLREGVV